MSKQVGKVPHAEDNSAYAFNVPIGDIVKYAEIPYMPQLMAASRQKIKEVLQTELHRKDQIKSAIVVLCKYSVSVKDGDRSQKQ